MQQEFLQSVIQLNHDMASRSVGEYNIFSVLGIQEKEVLTCRFLADLMNPRGQHGQGAIFLRLFLDDVLGMPVNSEEELNHAVVTTEYLIDQERRIDIVIELGQRFIPIEVKIYAGEQKSQCYDYYTFARTRNKHAKVVYLTLSGYFPSKYSKESDGKCVPDEDIVCISFKDDIKHWCEKCKQISNLQMQSILSQYIDTIEQLTDSTDKERITMIANDLAASAEKLKAGKSIADSIKTAQIMVMRAVMDEFVDQMKPLQEKYHLERESQFNWYEYPECADLSFYDTYTTYPGINYVVKDATLIWGYQMWLRIEIEHSLFAGFCLFDPNADHEEAKGDQVDSFDEDTFQSVENVLKISQADVSGWWAIWRYLPTGTTKVTDDVPNFKIFNDAAIALADEDTRKEFVRECVQRIEESLLRLLK